MCPCLACSRVGSWGPPTGWDLAQLMSVSLGNHGPSLSLALPSLREMIRRSFDVMQPLRDRQASGSSYSLGSPPHPSHRDGTLAVTTCLLHTSQSQSLILPPPDVSSRTLTSLILRG